MNEELKEYRFERTLTEAEELILVVLAGNHRGATIVRSVDGSIGCVAAESSANDFAKQTGVRLLEYRNAQESQT